MEPRQGKAHGSQYFQDSFGFGPLGIIRLHKSKLNDPFPVHHISRGNGKLHFLRPVYGYQIQVKIFFEQGHQLIIQFKNQAEFFCDQIVRIT